VGCDVYGADVELEAACIRLEALGEETASEAAASCDRLPAPRNVSCRAAWVYSKSDRPEADRAELLDTCDGSPDCQFGVLDARPAGTYSLEVEECVSRVGRFASDCAGHAAQRLLLRNPSDAELRTAALLPHGDRLAGMVPSYLACSGRSTCPDLGPWTQVCVETMRHQGQLPCSNVLPARPPPSP